MSDARLHILLLLVAWLAPSSVSAQWRGPRLTSLGPEEGLASNVVSMIQDSTGHLYFATGAGMYRYDGNQFEFFGHDPLDTTSIGGGELYNLRQASDGLIWITTRMGGLNSFNPKTGKFKRYPVPKLPFKSIPTVHGLFEDSDSTLWVGATHFRLMEFDRKNEKFTTYTPDWIDAQKHGGRLSVLSITQDTHVPQRLWLSVLDHQMPGSWKKSYGLVAFDKRTHKFEGYACFGNTKYKDTQGKLWGTFWGPLITSFDPQTSACDTFHYPISVTDDYTKSISIDIASYHNEVLISTPDRVWRFRNDHTFEPANFSKSSEQDFSSLFVDRNENLWIGTSQGALVLNPDDQQIRFFSLDHFGLNFRIFPARLAYYEPGDVIYFSQDQSKKHMGFFRIPLDEGSGDNATFHSASFHIEGIGVDKHHRLWAAGDGKLYQIDPVHHDLHATQLLSKEDKPLPWILKMETNPEGWVCMIGSGEFIWFHSDSLHIRRVRLAALPGSDYAKSFDNRFDGFTLHTNGKAYLYSNEVHIIDLITSEVTALKYDTVVNPDVQQIQHIAEDKEGYIWMSTFVHTGKYRLAADSLILLESYGVSQGMIGPNPVELHIDHDGRVWSFNGSGINAINPKTKEVRFFGTQEGLPFSFMDPRQVLSIAGGRIATVSHTGIIVFNAEDLWNSAAPGNEPVVIKRIRTDGQQISSDVSVNYLTRLELKPGNKGVDIEFQALAYPTDYKMEYSYRIKGLQEEWISIGRNKLITLPSLAPGDYTFEIKAGNPLSHAPVKSIQIFVSTPLYQRIWFLLLISGIVISTIYLLLQRRIRRIREKEEERTAINKEMAELELKALRSQMNPHFMFNSLNSIKNYILHAEPKLAAEYLSNFAHLIRMILQNSREKAITLQEEVETLLLYIELEQVRFDNQFEFNCVIDEELRMEQIIIPPMLLQPFVENAIWHGLMHKKDKGHLMLSFAKAGDMVACTIDDDGVGRSKAAEMKSLSATKYKSMGMGITRDRIEIMNKMNALGITTEVIDKTDAAGKPTGTRVIVKIPANSEYEK